MANRVYETIIKVGASVSKAFRPDALNAAKALGRLGDEAKKLQGATKAAASIKKVEEAVAKSKAQYDHATAALRRFEEAEKAAGGATKESAKWRKAGEREVKKAAAAFDKATAAAKKNGDALRAAGFDTAALARDHSKLAAALAATERQQHHLARFEAARTRIFGDRKTPVPLMQKAGDQFRSVARDAMILGTAAAGAGVAMAGLVLKTLASADEIGDTSEKIGIGAVALQELRYGAKQSGAETEELDRSLTKMLVTVGKFKNAKGKGGGGAGFSIPGMQMLGEGGGGDGAGAGETDPFKRIGLDAKKLAALKPEEQFKKIASAFSTLKTQADRAAVAQAIFGKGGVALVPFLKEGAAGIDRLSAAGHKFGGIMSQEAVDAADAADKAMTDAKMAVTGLTTTLGAALLPTATKVFGEFSEWVSSNRGEIKAWAENAAKWIEGKGIPAIKKLAGEVKEIAAKVLGLVQAGAKLFGTNSLTFALGALAAVRLAPLVTTLGQIAIEGAKAATAIFRYATAAKAAKEAGGVGGFEPGSLQNAGKLIGAAASASMVLGAASVGYAIGSFLDEKFGISDWLAGENNPLREKNGKIVKGEGGLINAMAGGAQDVRVDRANASIGEHEAKLAKVKALQAKGLSYEDASGVVFRGIPAVIPKKYGPETAPLTIGDINITAPAGATEEHVDGWLAKLKPKLMAALEADANNRKRASFAE